MVLISSDASAHCVFKVDFVAHVAIWEHVSDVGECRISEFSISTWISDFTTGTVDIARETEHGEGESMSGRGDRWCDGTEVFGGVQGEGSGEGTDGWTGISVILEGNGEGVLVDDISDQTIGKGFWLQITVGVANTRLPDGVVGGGVTGHPLFGIGVGGEVPVPCAPFAISGWDLSGTAVHDGISDLSEVSTDDDGSGTTVSVGVVVSDVIVEHGVDEFSLSSSSSNGTTGDADQGIVDHEVTVGACNKGVESSPCACIWPHHSCWYVINILVEFGAAAACLATLNSERIGVGVVSNTGAITTSAKTGLSGESLVGNVVVVVLWHVNKIFQWVVSDTLSIVCSSLHVDDGPVTDAPDGVEVDDDIEVGSGIDLGIGTTIVTGWFDRLSEISSGSFFKLVSGEKVRSSSGVIFTSDVGVHDLVALHVVSHKLANVDDGKAVGGTGNVGRGAIGRVTDGGTGEDGNGTVIWVGVETSSVHVDAGNVDGIDVGVVDWDPELADTSESDLSEDGVGTTVGETTGLEGEGGTTDVHGFVVVNVIGTFTVEHSQSTMF